MANEPFFTANGNYQAPEFRRLLATFYQVASPGGVINGMAVTGGGGSNVSIAPGAVVVNDSTNGVYVADSTSASTVAIGSYAGSARVDTVYVYVSETAGTELSVGVAINSSSVPSLAIPLAHVAVNDASAIGSATNPITMVNNQAELTLVKGRYQPLANIGWTFAGMTVNPSGTNGGAPAVNTFSPPTGVQYYGPEYCVTNGILYLRGNIGNIGGGGSQAFLLKVPTQYAPRDTMVIMVPCTALFNTEEYNIATQSVAYDSQANLEFFDLVEIIGTAANNNDPRTPGGLYHAGKILGVNVDVPQPYQISWSIAGPKTYFLNTSWTLQQ